jgi:hypothetical protein
VFHEHRFTDHVFTFELASSPRSPKLLLMQKPDQRREFFRTQKSLKEGNRVKTVGRSDREKSKWILDEFNFKRPESGYAA